MKRLRSQLTYANVVATLALFLIVAGGTALAASKLADNSVGTKQIKKEAITAAKIKKGATTGSKIAAGAITGSNINLCSLGTVPSATTAMHAAGADRATIAENATNATTAADGLQLRRHRIPPPSFPPNRSEPSGLRGKPRSEHALSRSR